MEHLNNLIKSNLFWFLLWAIGCVGFASYYQVQRQNLYSYAEEVSSEYQVYLDGVLVDAENIEFSQYDIEINDEKQKIYLTKE